MQTLILAVSRPALAYVKAGVSFYEKRMRPLGQMELRYLKAVSEPELSSALLRASEGCLRIAMDERGKNLSTRELEQFWRDRQLHAVAKRVAFIIGPADGLTPQLRDACDHVFSLGRHTMQHELALLVLMEQLYRLHTLLANSPYHRGE